MPTDNQPVTGDFRLPARRNDEETLEKRLTDNAYGKILPARYLKRNDEGETIEEPEDLFERVAKNIAVAELVHLDEKISIDTAWIKPDHPRREELFEEVFGNSEPDQNDHTATLDETNAKYISYDALEEDPIFEIPESVKDWKNEYQRAMEHLDFIPNTPTLINAGTELQQLSACFVMSPEDDIQDIHKTANEAAQVFQSGGGAGYAFSNLRPYGDVVGSTGGIASGPITFMHTFDQVCETIAQGGVRRGAQMGVMSIDHPDIPFFVHAKNKDVSLAQTLKLNDPDDPTHGSLGEAIEEARGIIDDEGRVPKHLRNAVEGHLSNFNISVGVTDEFMAALEAGEEHTFTNPRTDDPHIATDETEALFGWFGWGEYVEVGEPVSMPASVLWTAIVEGAHQNGEPGVIYFDRVNDEHGFDVEKHPEFEVQATNPCAEQPLCEYEACNLGHINLSTLVEHDSITLGEFLEMESLMDDGWDRRSREDIVADYLDEVIEMEKLDRLIEVGTRFLDNVVTMSDFPIERISETVENNRKVGLGVMGLAQMYVQLGVRYGSEWGNEIARYLLTYIDQGSKMASHELALERGVFGNFDKSKFANPTDHSEWFEQQTGLDSENHVEGHAMRNYSTTTIAPTGTTSMIGNTTGGCEPIFNVAYYKNVTDDIQGDEMLVEFDDYFLDVLEANEYDIEGIKEEVQRQMQHNEFDGIGSVDAIPDSLAELFVTTNELSGIEHANVQVACQKGVDSGISKTINAPNDATVEDAKTAFERIYEGGGKSVTYYRDGSRTKQVLTTRQDNQDVEGEDDEEATDTDEAGVMVEGGADVSDTPTTPEVRERPHVMASTTERLESPQGGLYVTVSEDRNGPFELFAQIGKSGGYTQSVLEGMARLVSLNLRSGVEPEEIIDQLRGIRGPDVSWDNGTMVNSIPDAIALALERHVARQNRNLPGVGNETSKSSELSEPEATADGGQSVREVSPVDTGEATCDKCGSPLEISEGCEKCSACGWSKC